MPRDAVADEVRTAAVGHSTLLHVEVEGIDALAAAEGVVAEGVGSHAGSSAFGVVATVPDVGVTEVGRVVVGHVAVVVHREGEGHNTVAAVLARELVSVDSGLGDGGVTIAPIPEVLVASGIGGGHFSIDRMIDEVQGIHGGALVLRVGVLVGQHLLSGGVDNSRAVAPLPGVVTTEVVAGYVDLSQLTITLLHSEHQGDYAVAVAASAVGVEPSGDVGTALGVEVAVDPADAVAHSAAVGGVGHRVLVDMDILNHAGSGDGVVEVPVVGDIIVAVLLGLGVVGLAFPGEGGHIADVEVTSGDVVVLQGHGERNHAVAVVFHHRLRVGDIEDEGAILEAEHIVSAVVLLSEVEGAVAINQAVVADEEDGIVDAVVTLREHQVQREDAVVVAIVVLDVGGSVGDIFTGGSILIQGVVSGALLGGNPLVGVTVAPGVFAADHGVVGGVVVQTDMDGDVPDAVATLRGLDIQRVEEVGVGSVHHALVTVGAFAGPDDAVIDMRVVDGQPQSIHVFAAVLVDRIELVGATGGILGTMPLVVVASHHRVVLTVVVVDNQVEGVDAGALTGIGAQVTIIIGTALRAEGVVPILVVAHGVIVGGAEVVEHVDGHRHGAVATVHISEGVDIVAAIDDEGIPVVGSVDEGPADAVAHRGVEGRGHEGAAVDNLGADLLAGHAGVNSVGEGVGLRSRGHRELLAVPLQGVDGVADILVHGVVVVDQVDGGINQAVAIVVVTGAVPHIDGGVLLVGLEGAEVEGGVAQSQAVLTQREASHGGVTEDGLVEGQVEVTQGDVNSVERIGHHIAVVGDILVEGVAVGGALFVGDPLVGVSHDVVVLNLIGVHPEMDVDQAVATGNIGKHAVDDGVVDRSNVELTVQTVAAATILDGIVGGLAALVDGQVERHDAVATIHIATHEVMLQRVDRLGQAGIFIPVEAVASHSGGVAAGRVVESEVEGHDAVAAYHFRLSQAMAT